MLFYRKCLFFSRARDLRGKRTVKCDDLFNITRFGESREHARRLPAVTSISPATCAVPIEGSSPESSALVGPTAHLHVCRVPDHRLLPAVDTSTSFTCASSIRQNRITERVNKPSNQQSCLNHSRRRRDLSTAPRRAIYLYTLQHNA